MTILFRRVLTIAILSVCAGQAFAQNASIVKDSRRRQAFQRQVDEWAQTHATRVFLTILDRVDRVGVNVIEDQTVLPPDLGGPRAGAIIRVKVEMQAQGYGEDRFGSGFNRYDRHGHYDHFGRNVLLNCRIHQSVMARVDQSGRPAELIKGQTITTPVACLSRY